MRRFINKYSIILSVLGTIIFLCTTYNYISTIEMYRPNGFEIADYVCAFFLGILFWIALILFVVINIGPYKGIREMIKDYGKEVHGKAE